MLLYVDYGDEATNEWKRICALESTLDEPPPVPGDLPSLSWEGDVTLPSGTRLTVGANYNPRNLGSNIVVFSGEEQLLSVFGAKMTAGSHGPTILFKAPCGMDVQLMLGKYEE